MYSQICSSGPECDHAAPQQICSSGPDCDHAAPQYISSSCPECDNALWPLMLLPANL
jgi:hypothetical protein